MGNAQTSHRKGSKQVVTILQADGRVVEFPRPVRVADLLFDHPKHFVCHSSALVLLQQGKMLPPNSLLMRGEVYFLLPLPKTCPSTLPTPTGAENDPKLAAEVSPEAPKVRGTMKVLITKQQLAKILAEGSIKLATKAPEALMPMRESNVAARSNSLNSLRVLHRPSPSPIKRSVTWSPGLESISEVPVI